MFCEKCGSQLPDLAKFCTNCGTSVEGREKKETEKMLDTQIQLRIKPAFKFVYMIFPSAIVFMIFILIFSISTGAKSASSGIKMFIITTFIMVIILGIKTIINKKQYDSYCYDLYKTKIVYRDSFMNLSEKEVKYKHIREIAMHQTFIQRYFNIGNIVLFTNVETGLSNGIFIMNVENVKDVFKEVKSIINI